MSINNVTADQLEFCSNIYFPVVEKDKLLILHEPQKDSIQNIINLQEKVFFDFLLKNSCTYRHLKRLDELITTFFTYKKTAPISDEDLLCGSMENMSLNNSSLQTEITKKIQLLIDEKSCLRKARASQLATCKNDLNIEQKEVNKLCDAIEACSTSNIPDRIFNLQIDQKKAQYGIFSFNKNSYCLMKTALLTEIPNIAVDPSGTYIIPTNTNEPCRNMTSRDLVSIRIQLRMNQIKQSPVGNLEHPGKLILNLAISIEKQLLGPNLKEIYHTCSSEESKRPLGLTFNSSLKIVFANCNSKIHKTLKQYPPLVGGEKKVTTAIACSYNILTPSFEVIRKVFKTAHGEKEIATQGEIEKNSKTPLVIFAFKGKSVSSYEIKYEGHLGHLDFRKLHSSEAVQITRQLFEQLQHIHSLGFIHGDLKRENIVFRTHNNSLEARIIDYGFSMKPQEKNPPSIMSLGFYGSIFYTPMECLKTPWFKGGECPFDIFKVESYAISLTLLTCLYGIFPWMTVLYDLYQTHQRPSDALINNLSQIIDLILLEKSQSLTPNKRHCELIKILLKMANSDVNDRLSLIDAIKEITLLENSLENSLRKGESPKNTV